MISTRKFTRTATGYRVERVSPTGAVEYLGDVARDGRAWVISDTARGTLPGEPARYATRVDAVDALSAMLRAAAELDALPTDEPAADEVAPAVQPLESDGMPPVGDPRWALAGHRGVAITAVQHLTPAVAAVELAVHRGEQVVRPGDDRPSCASCGYFTGHTSWCPRRHAEQPAEQTTLELADDSDSMQPGETVNEWAARVYGEHEVADRTTPPAELDDRRLWLQFMLEDRALGGYDDDPNEPNDERHGALIAEIGRRFGADATEHTADWSVALHMSGDDLVEWARTKHEHLIMVATGRIVPEWRSGEGFDAELEHGGCETCTALIESAATMARATGSVGATYRDGEHAAVVSRPAYYRAG